MADALKRCSRPDCDPREQVRGDMRAGDYYDVIAANCMGRWGGVPEPHLYGVPEGSPEAATAKACHIVEASPDAASDFRICCKACGKATGWNRSDAPGMPGVGRDWSRKLWNGG
jgi:hypothetical protein